MAADEVNHDRWMRHALALAERGTGHVSPNPRVGCVIVHHDRILAEGWHARYGGPHAEAAALAALTHVPSDATLYVNLEPCSHHGKTPPCADAIIASGIKQVVVGMTDPYHEVAGRGINRLRDAGIDVVVDVCHDEALWLNRYFTHHVTTGRPWIIVKVAQSLDGYIARTPDAQTPLTSAASRAKVHALRAEVDAVLTGIGTVRADDPLLTVRDVDGRDPHRIILDTSLQIPVTARVVTTAASTPCTVLCSLEASRSEPADVLRARQVNVVGLPTVQDRLDLARVFSYLGTEMRIASVMVEAGPGLVSSLLANGHVDELRVHTAPLLLGDGVRWNASPASSGSEPARYLLHELDLVDGDLHSTYLPIRA